jgi:hypothetical protein
MIKFKKFLKIKNALIKKKSWISPSNNDLIEKPKPARHGGICL